MMIFEQNSKLSFTAVRVTVSHLIEKGEYDELNAMLEKYDEEQACRAD